MLRRRADAAHSRKVCYSMATSCREAREVQQRKSSCYSAHYRPWLSSRIRRADSATLRGERVPQNAQVIGPEYFSRIISAYVSLQEPLLDLRELLVTMDDGGAAQSEHIGADAHMGDAQALRRVD